MKNWRSNGTGKLIPDILQELYDVTNDLREPLKYRLYIGTDSQHFNRKTRYATGLYLHKGYFAGGKWNGMGARGYFKSTKIDTPHGKNETSQIYNKIIKETNYTVDAIEEIWPYIEKIVQEKMENGETDCFYEIHVDISDLSNSGSYVALSASIGWLSGYIIQPYGKIVFKKHDENGNLVEFPFAASIVCDRLVRSRGVEELQRTGDSRYKPLDKPNYWKNKRRKGKKSKG